MTHQPKHTTSLLKMNLSTCISLWFHVRIWPARLMQQLCLYLQHTLSMFILFDVHSLLFISFLTRNSARAMDDLRNIII